MMLIVWIAVLAVAYVLVLFLVRKFVKGFVREGHNDVLVPLFLTAGTLYAVLLAFLVIAVWETYGAAKDNAAEEASTLATMYRQTNGMPPDERAKMRGLLREYTEAVVKEEWPIQAATGGASPKARQAVADIYSTFYTMKPSESSSSISVEFLHTFSTVAADRNRRTLQAAEALPPVLWFAILFGAAIIGGMSFMLFMEVFWPHAVMSGLMTVLIGTLLLITFALDRPFAGPMPLDSGAFEHSLSVFDAVDKGG
jgi:hypothetical protein